MAHTAARPATTWGPAVQNIYCLYMVGTSVRTSSVMNDRLCCFRFKALHGVRYKDTKPVKGLLSEARHSAHDRKMSLNQKA